MQNSDSTVKDEMWLKPRSAYLIPDPVPSSPPTQLTVQKPITTPTIEMKTIPVAEEHNNGMMVLSVLAIVAIMIVLIWKRFVVTTKRIKDW